VLFKDRRVQKGILVRRVKPARPGRRGFPERPAQWDFKVPLVNRVHRVSKVTRAPKAHQVLRDVKVPRGRRTSYPTKTLLRVKRPFLALHSVPETRPSVFRRCTATPPAAPIQRPGSIRLLTTQSALAISRWETVPALFSPQATTISILATAGLRANPKRSASAQDKRGPSSRGLGSQHSQADRLL